MDNYPHQYIYELTKIVDEQGNVKIIEEEENNIEISTEILCMFFLLLIAISSGHFLHKSGHKYLQEAGLTTMIGMVAGYGLKVMSV